jgi:hypothetical protein
MRRRNVDKCPRCGVGIDDDGDGDCSYCAKMSSTEIMLRRVTNMSLVEMANLCLQTDGYVVLATMKPYKIGDIIPAGSIFGANPSNTDIVAFEHDLVVIGETDAADLNRQRVQVLRRQPMVPPGAFYFYRATAE